MLSLEESHAVLAVATKCIPGLSCRDSTQVLLWGVGCIKEVVRFEVSGSLPCELEGSWAPELDPSQLRGWLAIARATRGV